MPRRRDHSRARLVCALSAAGAPARSRAGAARSSCRAESPSIRGTSPWCSPSRATASRSGRSCFRPGALAAQGGGKRFVYRDGASQLSLRRVDGAYRLTVGLRGFDLAALDPASPPQFMKQILKIGDDCFASVLACTAKRSGRVACRSERTVLLAGRVERAGRSPLAGSMLTLIDDRASRRFPSSLRRTATMPSRGCVPAQYRLRARLIGYDDVMQSDVVLAKGRTSASTSDGADRQHQRPATGERLVLAHSRQVAGPEDPGRLHPLVRQLPPDRRATASAAPRPRTSGAASSRR